MNAVKSYSGVLTEKKELKTGLKQDNTKWFNQEFIIKTNGKYPKTILFVAKAKAVEYLEKKNLGDEITVDFELDSKSTSSGTFTTATAVKIV